MQQNRLNIWQVWHDRPIKNAVILAMLLNNAVSFSGIMAYSFFGVFLLKAIGFSEESAGYANAAAASLCIVSSITSTFVIEKTGRKKLIMTSLISLASLNLLVMLLIILFNETHAHFLGYLFIALLCAFLFVFSFGIGSISWFLASELAPPQACCSVQSLAISTQYLTSFISPIIYFPLESIVGPYSFLIFIVPLYFTAYYFHRNLPETRNREISDIMIDLRGKVDDMSLP
jgi:MFS family permease